MARITHPNPQPGKTRPQVGGVVFVDGVAEVNLHGKPVLRDYYEKHEFGIEESKPHKSKAVVVPAEGILKIEG
ncbi:hypothetical protein [Herbiconiux sp. YIM B11900]|uniref:hypothetical protein n=1 Tax=Herbiconiux sp. YIM B11900 TaxID=3404131 RepID=UPI003F828CD6